MYYFLFAILFFSVIVILNKTNYYNIEKNNTTNKEKIIFNIPRRQFIFSPVNYNNDNDGCILLLLKTPKLSNCENV